MSAVLEFSHALESLDCSECGIVYGLPVGFLRRKREEGGMFHCPSGHRQYFTETEVARVRKALALAQQAAEVARRQTADALHRAEVAETDMRKARAGESRLRQRAKGGLCPCCKRSFVGLARHMKTMHPAVGAIPKVGG